MIWARSPVPRSTPARWSWRTRWTRSSIRHARERSWRCRSRREQDATSRSPCGAGRRWHGVTWRRRCRWTPAPPSLRCFPTASPCATARSIPSRCRPRVCARTTGSTAERPCFRAAGPAVESPAPCCSGSCRWRRRPVAPPSRSSRSICCADASRSKARLCAAAPRSRFTRAIERCCCRGGGRRLPSARRAAWR